MANIKSYKIEINGITESIDAVNSLMKQLNALEARIKEINSLGVKVDKINVGAVDDSAAANALRVQKEINKLKEEGLKLDAKIAAAQDEVYKKVDATKELYKKTIADQKGIAAQERLVANEYTNTMQGMKQHLADLKSVINTTDLGDGDQIKKMTQEANELNDKLKEIEKSYGQFGRNVGNYPDSMGKLKIDVAGVVQEFDSAKQAAKTLGNELKTLQAKKDQGMMLSEDELKRFEALPEIVAQIKSSIADAGKPMDNLMDTMQSFVAIAQTYKGVTAFFGIDNDEIEKSIQKLVGLQNAMQGLQTIQEQMQSGEGVGGWIKKASTAMDTFAASITKSDKAAKALSFTLKALTGIAIVAAIIAATKALDNFNKKLKESNRGLEEGVKAYSKASAEISMLQKKLDDFNGSKKQEKKLVDDLNSKYGTALGQYKSLAGWKDALRKKGAAYCQVLQKEAELQAVLSLYTENYIKLQKARKAQEEGNQDTVDEILKLLNGESNISRVLAKIRDDFKAPLTDNLDEFNNQLSKEIDEYEKNGERLLGEAKKIQTEIDEINADNKLNDNSDQIDKNTSKTENAIKESTNKLNQLEIRLMQDGLNKRLRQLDEDERQTIQKLKEGGRKTENAIKKIQTQYEQLRLKEIRGYLKQMTDSVESTSKEIANIEFTLNIGNIKNQVSDLQNQFDKMSADQPIRNRYISTLETKEVKELYQVDEKKIGSARSYENLFRTSEATNNADEYYRFLTKYIKDKNKELYQDISDYVDAIAKAPNDEIKEIYGEGFEKTMAKAAGIFEKEYANELLYVRNYTQKIDQTLTESFKYRLKSEQEYDEHYRQELMKNIAEQAKLQQKAIDETVKQQRQAERNRYSAVSSGMSAQLSAVTDGLMAIENKYGEKAKDGAIVIKSSNKEIINSYRDLQAKEQEIRINQQDALRQNKEKLAQITKEGEEKRKAIEISAANEISSVQEKTFSNQIENLRDAQSKINELMNRQPVVDSFGIVDVAKTKKQYKEIITATEEMMKEILVQQALLNTAFSRGLLKPEAVNSIKGQLTDLMASFKEMLKTTSDESKDVIGEFLGTAMQYVQALGQGLQQIMSAVWDAQDTQFDNESRQLDKLNEKLQDAMDENEAILQKHQQNVNNIESELQTARGARREHLIDQLNAEVEAERRAAAEKKKIEKQQEALQKKQDDLDWKRTEAQYNREVTQAAVTSALAVINALATKPFIPVGLASAALATSLGAAQIAIMKANPPQRYADGGIILGARHSDGGVKVLGGTAEVEGGEMIVNRNTTSYNVDLLEYVNSKKRRLDISDFIDFYSSDRPRKNIRKMSPFYADGGVLPQMRTDLDVTGGLINAFEQYSNRPVIVAVTDINRKQAQVRNVEVLAGLS